MSEQPTEDIVDPDVVDPNVADPNVAAQEAESEELPLTPKMMAMMTITMFVGFVIFVAVCLPFFFFD